ncbi:MAG TPA: DUF1987 domain-containing protein [Bacteroidia bacterium]|nr:DUF1987 domain-containing protein [Bacteroidia bacterium]
MENLKIASTNSTPEIDFRPNGELFMTGVTYPEDAFKFYEPVSKWLKDFKNSLPKNKIVLNIELDYVNTASLRILIDLINTVNSYKATNEVEMFWKYEDEDNLEFGHDVERITNSKFNFVAIG